MGPSGPFRRTTMVLPGSKVVTVPSVEVVVVVDSDVTGFFVVDDSVVVVLVWAKANGAIAAQARIRILFFILVPSYGCCVSTARICSPSSPGGAQAERCRSRLDRARAARIQSFEIFRGLSDRAHQLTCAADVRYNRSSHHASNCRQARVDARGI